MMLSSVIFKNPVYDACKTSGGASCKNIMVSVLLLPSDALTSVVPHSLSRRPALAAGGDIEAMYDLPARNPPA